MKYRLVFSRARRKKKKTTTKRLRRISSTSLPVRTRSRPVVLRAQGKPKARPKSADRFRIDETIEVGEGTRACLVTEVATGRALTLRTCTLAGAGEWDQWDRFKHECEVLRSLRHPGIPRYIEHGEQDGNAYLVTEPVEGDSLQARLDRAQRYTDAKLEHIVRRGLAILDYLHELNPPLYHCCIHPGALVVSDKGNVILTNFGYARTRLDTEAEPHAEDGYAAPEHVRGEVSAATDLFAFAATIVAVASGRDASLLPRRGLEIDIDTCMKPTALRERLRGLLSPDPQTRLDARSRK